jgi:hypothetical protein
MKLHNIKVSAFPYVHLLVRLRCEKPGQTPKYKTSMIRGIIGRILKQQVCCYDLQQPCAACEFRHSCAYALLFESPDEAVKKLNIGGTVPHPYIVRCHDYRTSFQAGQELEFELLLLGPSAVGFAMHFLGVFEKFHHYPFGSDRVFFRLKAVYQRTETATEAIWEDYDVVKPEMTYFFPKEKPYEKILIQFITPLRMMRKGKVLRTFSINEFLWQVNHRVWQLYRLYDLLPSEPSEPLPLIAEHSVSVIQCTWEDVTRYSMRQQKMMKIGGMKAIVALERTDALDRWLPLLLFTERFHVGKAVTFGLGQYVLWFQ